MGTKTLSEEDLTAYRLIMLRASVIFADLAESTLNQMLRTAGKEKDHITRKNLNNASVQLEKAVDRMRGDFKPEMIDADNKIAKAILEIAINMQQLPEWAIQHLEAESNRLLDQIVISRTSHHDLIK